MSQIWFQDYTLDQVSYLCKNNMLEHLGIEITEIGSNFIKGRMPVDRRTVQSMNTLHGGASVALAESVASIGTFLTLDPKRQYCVGMEINANHIKRVSTGYVHAISKPVHRGRRSQVWTIEIFDDEGNLACISRITMAIVDHL